MGDDAPRARLLLVDDDRTMLEHMSAVVRDLGHEAIIAQTWTEALRLFRDGRPDLVLLDVMMPTMDGYKLARIMKGDTPQFVPIILLTALEDLEAKRRGMAAGADDFMTKPVTPLELQIRLQSLLRIKQLTDELARANLQLARLATTDELTGLATRRQLYHDLEREFQRAKRHLAPLAVLMIDVDHFKQINDTIGHQAGDRVLRLIGEALRMTIRATDYAGRFGGEEFMVLAPETGMDSVGVLAERLRQAVAQATSNAPDTPPVSVSIGAATSEHPEAENAEHLVRLADECLYAAKRAGRDRAVIAKPPA
jgi:two-component system, cell cycle response regulator